MCVIAHTALTSRSTTAMSWMQKVRIGMTDSTFLICREVEVSVGGSFAVPSMGSDGFEKNAHRNAGAEGRVFTRGEGAGGEEQRSGERRKTH